MARKSESTPPPARPGEEKVVLFGWCMTGHHTNCILEFTGHKCSCKCHKDLTVDSTEEEKE